MNPRFGKTSYIFEHILSSILITYLFFKCARYHHTYVKLSFQPCLKAPFKRGRNINNIAKLATENPPFSTIWGIILKLVMILKDDINVAVTLWIVFNLNLKWSRELKKDGFAEELAILGESRTTLGLETVP